MEADSGSISLTDFEYGTYPPSRVVDVRRKGVGWIFQDFHLVDRLTALDNVIFALELSGIPSAQAESQAKDALMKVGLSDRMNFIPDQLSGGQRQRVAIARAISGSRPLILADEPTGNLDSKSGHEIMNILDDLHQKGNTIILVTHEDDIAQRAHRIIRLLDGEITEDLKIKSK